MRPTNNVLLLFLLITGFSFNSYSQWVLKNPLPGTSAYRDGAVTWVIGNKCYVVGGNGHNDLLEYDPSNGQWTNRAPIPQGITMFGMGFVCNGKGYLCGGNGPGFFYYKSLWEYDPQTGQWTPKRDFPTGNRASGCAFTIGNKGYVGCGDDSSFAYSDFYRYDPDSDSWNQIPAFPGGFRTFPYSFGIGSKGFVGGGKQFSEMNDLWQFDTLSNFWIQRASLPGNPRQCAASFSSNDFGFVALGQTGFTSVFDDSYKYDPLSNSWDTLPSFTGGGRAWPAGFAYGNNIYLTTGWDFSTFYDDLYMLEISTGINKPAKRSFSIKVFQRNEELVIEFDNETHEESVLSLIDLQGRTIKKNQIENSGETLQRSFMNVEGVPKGVYLLNIKYGNKSGSSKVVVF